MASIDPALSPDPKVKTWAGTICTVFIHQLDTNTRSSPPVSIFQVPETITTTKPDAYEPQHIGLGPNHHFRPQPYAKMEQKKLVVVQSVLKQHHKTRNDFVNIFKKIKILVSVIRSCYDRFLIEDDTSLAWVFVIDSLFLLDLIQANDPTKRFMSQDIMMLENQIPCIMLRKIYEALHSSPDSTSNQIHVNDNFSLFIFRSFCEIHSPLELCQPFQYPTHAEHLLDYMYRSIIKNLGEQMSMMAATEPSSVTESISHFTYFFNKLPQQQIVQLYEKVITGLKNFTTKKVTIPSASKLQGRGGFMFRVLGKEEGIKNIWIYGNTFFLPCLTLKEDSEVILRNLVAYETLIPNSRGCHFPVTEYMDMMCGLITNVDDVKLLKKEGIVKSDLGEDKVLKMFVGMSSSIVMSLNTKDKFILKHVVREANEVYESKPMIRGYLLLKKLASWVLVGLTAIGSFVGATWKIVAFMVSIVSVFLLTYQAYCEVYGCDKTSVTLLPYASS